MLLTKSFANGRNQSTLNCQAANSQKCGNLAKLGQCIWVGGRLLAILPASESNVGNASWINIANVKQGLLTGSEGYNEIAFSGGNFGNSEGNGRYDGGSMG